MPGPDVAAPATVMDHATASARRRLRWWGAVAGVALAVVDTLSLGWLGADFRMWGRDVTWLVALWFSGSLALGGFLLGDALEGRRRERAAAEALAAARARLAQSEKLAALGQLAAAVAHEVRNPLAVVRSAAQGLTETLSDGDVEGHRAAAFIIAEVDRLGSVVTSLLAFARPLRLSPRPIPVRDVITHAIELAGSELAAKGVRLRREEPPALSRVYADGDLVCQVLVGILANAAQAAPAGGEVTVTARAADGAVALAVADDGPGVPAEIRGRIFEPFFTTRARGTGLGLAVARQIVEAHGGRIEVGDREGGGARFTLTLPTGEPA